MSEEKRRLMNATNLRKMGARVLLAASLGLVAATASHGNDLRAAPGKGPSAEAQSAARAPSGGLRIEGSTDPEMLRCQTQRCRNTGWIFRSCDSTMAPACRAIPASLRAVSQRS